MLDSNIGQTLLKRYRLLKYGWNGILPLGFFVIYQSVINSIPRSIRFWNNLLFCMISSVSCRQRKEHYQSCCVGLLVWPHLTRSQLLMMISNKNHLWANDNKTCGEWPRAELKQMWLENPTPISQNRLHHDHSFNSV